jgi:hypothetical protein
MNQDKGLGLAGFLFSFLQKVVLSFELYFFFMDGPTWVFVLSHANQCPRALVKNTKVKVVKTESDRPVEPLEP